MKRTVSLKARALRYLSAREYSKKELAGKLLRFLEEGDDLDALLNWLMQQGFLSDERFVESLIRRRISRYGNSRIKQELRNHNVNDTLTDTDLQALLQDEGARAYGIWERKFGQAPADARERAKQIRFLQQRGFSSDAIRKAMKNQKD